MTVFERADRLGGLLMYGIPNMKLDKREVVQRRIELMEQEGVKFVCNTEVGDNVAAKLLRREFDAMVLCTGATQPRDLPIEGRKLEGIHFAMEFLTANTRSLLDGGHGRRVRSHARGKDVIVIGGGDTGTDCVGTSLRHGCRSLVQLEILPRPPEERASDNPWPEWPKVYKLDYGQEEAAAKFGADPRVYLTTATKFVGDADGPASRQSHRAGRMGTKRQGPVRPARSARHRAGAARATGAAGDGLPRAGAAAARTNSASNATRAATSRPSTASYATSIKGVFAAGDCRRGQSLVVWAINEGRGAARECDRYLMG